MGRPQKKIIRIPRTLVHWPFPHRINPHYQEAKYVSQSWIESFHAFEPRAQDAFNRCDFAHLRVGCELINLFFVVDEVSDLQSADVIHRQVDIVLDALRNPHKPCPAGEWVGGEITRQFWERANVDASDVMQRRFLKSFGDYLESVVDQARDRDCRHIRDIEGYMEVRRKNIGCRPLLALMLLEKDVPEEIFDPPLIEEMTRIAIDVITDMYSFNREKSQDDADHNFMTVVMHSVGMNIARAMAFTGRRHEQLAAEFVKLWEDSKNDPACMQLSVQRYIESIGNLVRTNDQWSFESQRYFGRHGLKVKRTSSILRTM
ncbi:terpenoid synthase [Punctularia strigosozonata HHB-11173 SS5]|uniref:terpenoid synthase n=1 Tax=Punctularia strigosozonata (strain HHB-11173) TaxID=741275 RepID=UPI00044173AF|nr:terpenoid synthase [Punctularia strigosozonata HHB-11173 SS5]EIN06625.1 terpenoid synthase [Punctularia strigosozonata HHB-11173 SS5]